MPGINCHSLTGQVGGKKENRLSCTLNLDKRLVCGRVKCCILLGASDLSHVIPIAQVAAVPEVLSVMSLDFFRVPRIRAIGTVVVRDL